ncbi:hypothetical protein HYO62_02040 [Aerococcaceae bacterium DSM 111022]|nr:hypothetical protein [Aerococcaceae bacterium DSM 111022]
MITIETQQSLAIEHLSEELKGLGLTLVIDKKLYNDGNGFHYFTPIFVLSGTTLKATVERDGNISYALLPESDGFQEADYQELHDIVEEYYGVFMIYLEAMTRSITIQMP